MIKCAIFDLDGTLVDTAEDLGRATAYVLEQFGVVPKWTDADYRKFVGNGARILLDRAFEHKLNDSELDRALDMFKKSIMKFLPIMLIFMTALRMPLMQLKARVSSLP